MRACVRSWGLGNTIGQANGVYDKPLDLQFWDYTDEKTNLKGKSLSHRHVQSLRCGCKFRR